MIYSLITPSLLPQTFKSYPLTHKQGTHSSIFQSLTGKSGNADTTNIIVSIWHFILLFRMVWRTRIQHLQLFRSDKYRYDNITKIILTTFYLCR